MQNLDRHSFPLGFAAMSTSTPSPLKTKPATGYLDNYALSEGYDPSKVSPGCQYTSATLKTTISSLLRRPEAFFDHFFAFGDR